MDMMVVITKDYSKNISGEKKMIKTIKVTVAGEETSFYIEPKHKELLIETLEKLDIISTPATLSLPQIPLRPKLEVPKWLSRNEGGCVKCGMLKGKRRMKKMYCLQCQKKRRSSRIGL